MGFKGVKKIVKCGKELTRWSKRCFGSVQKELEKKKREQLKEAEQRVVRIGDSSRMKILEGEVNILLDKEAKMWRQRSKVLWLKDGDRSTRFFHNKTSQW